MMGNKHTFVASIEMSKSVMAKAGVAQTAAAHHDAVLAVPPHRQVHLPPRVHGAGRLVLQVVHRVDEEHQQRLYPPVQTLRGWRHNGSVDTVSGFMRRKIVARGTTWHSTGTERTEHGEQGTPI